MLRIAAIALLSTFVAAEAEAQLGGLRRQLDAANTAEAELAGRHAEAEPLLSLAGEGERSDTAFYLQRIAQVYYEAGDNERALAVLEQARIRASAQGQQRLLEEITRTQTRWQAGQ